MSKIINGFDTHVNFWEVNPQLKIAGIFKKHYEEDKSKQKATSSKVMWFVALVTDLDSKFYSLPFDDRVELIEEDFLNSVGYYKEHKAELDELITFYQKVADTPAERHIRQWDDTLEKRSEFLRTMEYNLDNFDKVDKLASNTQNIYKTLNQIKKDIEMERTGGGTAKGGSMESLSDTGEI